MVCLYLSSGSPGSEQDRPVEGTKTSTLVSLSPSPPPEMMIPGMVIIIRVLLRVVLTLCSRESGHVLPQVGSTDTSNEQEEDDGQPCNHLFPTAWHSSLRRLGLHTFADSIYTN